MPAEYCIYRVTSITDDESTVAQPALLHVGTTDGNNARHALVNWYADTGETEVGEFVVIPLSHHHALSPTVSAQPRLSFS